MLNMSLYILEGQKVVPCEDIVKWGAWFENVDRVVAKMEIGSPVWMIWIGKLFRTSRFDPVCISTVFLGMNHSLGDEEPELFETMIFGGKYDGKQWRYADWEEAVAGHKKAIKKVIEL